MRRFPRFTKVARLVVLVILAAAASERHIAAQTSGASQLPPEVLAYADTILTNGKVLTVDSAFSIREAIALRDGKVLATGTTAVIARMAGPKTRRIDLGGRTVTPGIIDTHLHTWQGALSSRAKEIGAIEPRFRDYLDRAILKGGSVAELLQNLKAVADTRKPGTWINAQIGSPEFGPIFWDKNRRGDLDVVTPNNPLILTVPIPGFAGIMINTKAIDAMKAFYGYTPTEYELDETGLPNGRVDVVLAESMIADLLFDHPMQSMYPAFKEEAQRLASFGITTNSGRLLGLAYQPVFREMDRRGELPIRIAYNALGTQVFPHAAGFYQRMGDVTDMGTDMLWMDGAGVVHVDLAPCSTIKPQTEIFANCMISESDTLRYKALYQAVKSGNRIINTHVAGDRAADELMGLIEAASKAAGLTPEQIQAKGHAMDHCTLNPRPDQIERGKKLGIIWACAPGTLESSSERAGIFGIEAVNRWSVPAGSIIRAGGRIAGHGEGVRGDSYFTNLEILLTRKDSKGTVWGRDEAIDRKDVLRMYTIWSADYVARPDRMGSLEPGKFADLLVLDKDYMTIPNEQFDSIRVLMTIVGGKIVFQKEGDSWTSSIPN